MLSSRTFLSPNVRYMICDLPKEESIKHVTEGDECEIWHELDSVVSGIVLEGTDDYLNAVKAILPSAKVIHRASENHNFWSPNDEVFLWFSGYTSLPACISLEDDLTTIMLTMLKLISALERALGDICISRERQCPFLLRDLLLVEELGDIFGETEMKILRILIGNPSGINMRNLAWHGFLSPSEIPLIFLALLVLTCKKMARNIKLHSVPARSIIRNSKAMEFLENQLESWLILEEDGKFLRKVSFLTTDAFLMAPYVEKAFNLYLAENHGDCAILLLPCLESVMRILFALVNKCEKRILTAESSCFYTTMDEVLAQFLEDGSENKFRFALEDNLMMLFMDLFILQDGLRLRDRLSHGEMAPAAVSRLVVTVLIYLFLKIYALIGAEESDGDSCSFCARKNLCKVCAGLAKDGGGCCNTGSVVENFTKKSKCYQSLFHPTSIGKRAYSECKAIVETLGNIPVPDSFLNSFSASSGQESAAKVSSNLAIAALEITNTLYRNDRGEMEIAVLLKNSARECLSSAINVRNFLAERWRLYNGRLLRSRQRSNYERFIVRMSEICSLFVSILAKISEHFSFIDRRDWQVGAPLSSHVRELKGLLKTTENLRSLTSRNKWDDVCCLIPRLQNRRLGKAETR